MFSFAQARYIAIVSRPFGIEGGRLMGVVIQTRELRKSFVSRDRKGAKTVDAVNGVDLEVGEGEIFGFLGPNGAGKTTTLRMLATLLTPDGGTAMVAGADLRTQPGEVRRRIGYVAQGGSTWDDSTAREELVLQARLYGLSKEEAHLRAARALDSFQLADYADRKCKTYSGGQRRRVDIALGIIHAPQVVFLDEPTTGLDPQSRAHMWDEVRRLRDEGMTVFLTTHYLEEADALCDRLAIIDQGRIVTEGTPAELKRDLSGDVLVVGIGPNAVEAAASLLRGQSYVNRLETTEDGALRLYVDDGATAIPQVLRAADGAGLSLTTVELHRPSLDDVFLAKTGRSLRES
jgi:ABC-2 type transport system ATP-binding protein